MGFQYFDQNIMRLECHSFMTDYEHALRNALASVAPEAKITSCWFHFTQSCKRKACKLPGLIDTIHGNPEAKKCYYELLALPLLPAGNIPIAFQVIKMRIITLEIPNFNAFLTYYENQWLKRVCVILFLLSFKLIFFKFTTNNCVLNYYRRDQTKYLSLVFQTDQPVRLKRQMEYLGKIFRHMPISFGLCLRFAHKSGTKQKWRNPLSKVEVKHVPFVKERVRFV